MKIIKTHKTDFVTLVVLFVLIMLFAFLHLNNIYFKDGSSAIYRAKLKAVENEDLAFNNEQKRILFIGNSKILSGINPVLFDSLTGKTSSTLNLAMGGKSASDGFQMLLNLDLEFDVLVLQDNFPFYELEKPEKQSFLKFNNFFKDLYYFGVRARSKNKTLRQWYSKTKKECQEMIKQKGYYYIAAQAIYPTEQLPDTFTHSSDTPDKEYNFGTKQFLDSDPFLNYIIKQNITVYIVPNYFRENQYSNSSESRVSIEAKSKFTEHKIYYLDEVPYYIYPNKYFSDITHLNKKGANLYTNDIHEVLKKQLVID